MGAGRVPGPPGSAVGGADGWGVQEASKEIGMIRRSRLFGSKTRVTFSRGTDQPAGVVSVVGTFNGWTPGSHELVPRRNGSRSVSVTLPAGEHRFRYLAADGVWFDDLGADEIDSQGGLIRT